MDMIRTSLSFAGQEDPEANVGSGMTAEGFDREGLYNLAVRM